MIIIVLNDYNFAIIFKRFSIKSLLIHFITKFIK